MKNTVIYDSKYGTTQKMAELIAMVVGYCKVTPIEHVGEDDQECDYLILGSPIFSGKISKNMMAFLKENWLWIRKKQVFFFVVNLEGQAGERYLMPLKYLLRGNLLLSKSLGGYLQVNGLDPQDYETIQLFCDSIGLPFQTMNYYDLHTVVSFAKEIKEIIDKRQKKLDSNLVTAEIEKFLSAHNTCALCTGHQNSIRATPIEYTFHKKMLYFMSEGGLKFFNMLLNPNVSVAIFDPYTAMSELGGMHLSGTMQLVEHLSDEYFTILNLRGISHQSLKKIPIKLYVFKVQINQIDFLNSDFKEYGGEAKQLIVLK